MAQMVQVGLRCTLLEEQMICSSLKHQVKSTCKFFSRMESVLCWAAHKSASERCLRSVIRIYHDSAIWCSWGYLGHRILSSASEMAGSGREQDESADGPWEGITVPSLARFMRGSSPSFRQTASQAVSK